MGLMRLDVPHYRQSTEFTCGPACVMMVLKLFGKEIEMNKRQEFEIWRECNMIGSLGSDAFGLSIPLLKRGIGVKIVTERKETIPIKRIVRRWGENRGQIAKYAMALSYDKSKNLGAKILFRKPKVADIKEALNAGAAPIVLVNMYDLHRYNVPHWIVVSGYEEDWFYVNDPYRRRGQTRIKEEVLNHSIESLATKIRASRSMLQTYPLSSNSI
ncbi:MAG: peptidase C39 family protein [Nitrososphaerales archaeon]